MRAVARPVRWERTVNIFRARWRGLAFAGDNRCCRPRGSLPADRLGAGREGPSSDAAPPWPSAGGAVVDRCHSAVATARDTAARRSRAQRDQTWTLRAATGSASTRVRRVAGIATATRTLRTRQACIDADDDQAPEAFRLCVRGAGRPRCADGRLRRRRPGLCGQLAFFGASPDRILRLRLMDRTSPIKAFAGCLLQKSVTTAVCREGLGGCSGNIPACSDIRYVRAHMLSLGRELNAAGEGQNGAFGERALPFSRARGG